VALRLPQQPRESHASSPIPREIAKPTAPPPKRAPRDSALSTYHNPDYGVSFRYPRNYLLEEGFDSEDPSILNAQQELAARQPGSILVATVTIPPDAYPNTTFRSGTLQLVVNPTVAAEACQAFAAPEDEYFTSGSRSIQGITFNWRERGSAAMARILNRDYAGFSNGACYESFLESSLAPTPIPTLTSRKPTTPNHAPARQNCFFTANPSRARFFPSPVAAGLSQRGIGSDCASQENQRWV